MEDGPSKLEIKQKPPFGLERMYELARELKNFLENPRNRIPPTQFNFFFSPHDSLEDFEGLRAAIDNSDVFFSEREGWHSTQLKFYNLVAQGQDYNTKGLETMMDLGLLSQVKGIGKPVVFIDVPNNHPLDVEFRGFYPKLSYSGIGGENYIAKLKNLIDITKLLARNIQGREEYMMEQIGIQIKNLLSKNPKIKNLPSLKIAFYAGSGHSSLLSSMTLEGINTGSNMTLSESENPKTSFFQESVHQLRVGNIQDIDEARSKKMLFSIFLNEKLYDRLKKKTPYSDKVDSYIRKIFDLFSIEEIEQVLNQSSLIASSQVFFRLLNEKGIDITKAGEELKT